MMNRLTAFLWKLQDCKFNLKYQQGKKMFVGDALPKLHNEVEEDVNDVIPFNILQH